MITKLYKGINSMFLNYRYRLNNAFIFKWEFDFFAFSKSGYCIEVEIKTSKSDFKADFKKTLPDGILKHEYLQDKTKTYKPNKFAFAFPKGLINYGDIPDQYGIIELTEFGCRMTRNPKFLHKTDLMASNKFLKSLLDKFYYRNIDLRILMELRDYDIKYKQERLKL